MIDKILEMLQLQNSINEKVNPDWKKAGYDWYVAIFTEAVELLDHIGWKWWKKQEPNLDQCKLEIVDIWHFCLSVYARDIPSCEYKKVAAQIAQVFDPDSKYFDQFKIDVRKMIEAFIRETIETKRPNLYQLAAIMKMLDMSFDELYSGYIAKNVLNFFRQDNGYKEGTYIKTWNGKEDNEYLVEIIDSVGADTNNFAEKVKIELQEIYKHVLIEEGNKNKNT